MSSDPVLISGGGKRAGLHPAHAFLRRAAPIIGTYRTRCAEPGELEGRGAELYPCDFDRRDDIDALIANIERHHKHLRGIIHKAPDWLSDDAELPPAEVIGSMMRRQGGLEEIQRAVDYLFASRYVTGCILLLDDGRHLR